MHRLSLVLFSILLVFLAVPNKAFAAELSVNNVPTTIDQSQEFEVDVNFSCPGCGDSFLRGVFYPSGNNYFGYTQDSSGNWSNASAGNCNTYFKVEEANLTEGSWSGKLKFKPDIDSKHYSGPKEYFFKIGRYTPSCSSSSLVWSSEKIITISGSTPTPTDEPDPTDTPTPTKTPTPKKTPTPTKKLTVTPTHSTRSNSSGQASSGQAKKLSEKEADSEDLFLAGENKIALDKSPRPEAGEVQVLGEKTSRQPFIFIGLGIIFFAVCGIFAYLQFGDKIFVWKKASS